MNRTQKLFLAIVGILILSAIAYSAFQQGALRNDYEVTSGRYLDFFRGVKTGGGVQFSYLVEGRKYKEIGESPPPRCQDNLFAFERTLRQIHLPVVYQRNNPRNAEILLFASQYKYFDISIPDSLFQLIVQISSCE